MTTDRSTPPRVSVVVPFLNRERHLRSSIEALVSQERVGGPYEVILVNNGSTDRSASIAAEYDRLIVLEEPTEGAYAARNTGLRVATAPVVAFTDADCVVAPDWLRAIQDAMQDASVGIAVGRCEYPAEASLPLRLLAAYENAKTEFVVTRRPPSQQFAYANNMAVRASVFDEIGEFREWKRAADTELVHRLAARRPDLRLTYCHAMRMTHLEFRTARARLQRLSLYTQTNSRIESFRELRWTDRVGVLQRFLSQRARGR